MIRKVFTLILLLILTSVVQAQNSFMPGSITLKGGVPKPAMIKYSTWQYNPAKISYKLEGSETVTTGSVEQLEAFTIDDKAQYIAADVRVDVSSNIAKQVSNSRDPKWEDQRLFLKSIIDQGVKLYYLKTPQYERFFYQKINEDDFIQLVYKPYVSLQSYKSYNQDFRKQLKDNFRCEALEVNYRELAYKYKEIVGFFADYNKCLGYEVASVDISRPKAETRFSLKAGVATFGGSFAETPQLGRRTDRIESDYESSAGFVQNFLRM